MKRSQAHPIVVVGVIVIVGVVVIVARSGPGTSLTVWSEDIADTQSEDIADTVEAAPP